MAQSIHFTATVTEVIVHNDRVHSYTLVSEKALPRFLPGQFIHLSLESYDPSDFWPESRVFSVANSIFDNRTVKLVVGAQGNYTQRIINELHVGSLVSCKGPYGDFIVRTEEKSDTAVILVAGGTGITPFSAFMESLLQQETLDFSKCFLFYGTRSSDLLIYRNLADACAAKFKNFEVFYFIENIGLDKTLPLNITFGKLNIHSILDIVKSDSNNIFYLSGPRMMIDSFSHELKNVYRYANENVIIDAW